MEALSTIGDPGPLTVRDDNLPSHHQGSSLAATGIIGAGSALAIVLSAVTAKAYATLLGPTGVGAFGLMQSLVTVASLVAGFGLGTVLVRNIASETGTRDDKSVRETIAAGRTIAWLGGAAAALLILTLREQIAAFALGDVAAAGSVAVLAPAVTFSVAASAEVAIMTAASRVRSATVVHVGTYAVAAVSGVGLAAALGTDGLAAAILLTAVAHFAVGLLLNRRDAPPTLMVAGVVDRSRALLTRGSSIVASQLAGVGVQALTPFIVLHLLSVSDVGYYRAAATISVGYLGFFLATLSYDYLPRVSRERESVQLQELIERRMRLTAAIAVPLILIVLAGADLLVSVLYSSEFAPSSDLLRWFLVGDLLRVPAWVLAFTLIAHAPGRTYLLLEVFGAVLLLVLTGAGIELFGVVGSGLAYAVAQSCYLIAAWLLAGQLMGSVPGRLQLVIAVVAMVSAGFLWIDVSPTWRLLLFSSLGGTFAALAWPRLLRLHREGRL